MKAADGRAPETTLTRSLEEATGVACADDFVPWMERASKGEVAALAPRVVEAADRGDEGAAGIVDRAVGDLVAHVRAACHGSVGEVVLWGGLVAGEGPLRGRVSRALGEVGIRALDRTVDPVRGAAALAAGLARPDAPDVRSSV
jgi:N-acetylglucosamine kinase-like BadF-type ATPase